MTHEPIWLAGYPKSGNTWIRIFLANYILNMKRPLDVASYSTEIPFSCGETLKNLEHGHGQVYAKTHKDYNHKLHKTHRAVYHVRHPCDIVPSFSDHKNISINESVTHVAKHWPLHVSSWKHHAGLMLRYEDMYKTPVEIFGYLILYFGLSYDYERLCRAVKFSSFEICRKQEEKGGFKMNARSPHAHRFFRSGKIGTGHKLLTRSQINHLCSSQEFKEIYPEKEHVR
jgi:hypothetical protein